MTSKIKGFIITALIIYFSFIYDSKSYSQYDSHLFLFAAEPFCPDMRFSTTGTDGSPYLILSWPFHFVIYEFTYYTFSTIFFEPQWSRRGNSKSFLTGTRLWHEFDYGTFIIEGGGFISKNSERGGFAGIGTGIGEHNALVIRGYKSNKEKKFDVSLDFFFIVR